MAKTAMTYARLTPEIKEKAEAILKELGIPVATVVGMVSEGMAENEILEAYPDLRVEDIREALRYAAEAVTERQLPLLSAA